MNSSLFQIIFPALKPKENSRIGYQVAASVARPVPAVNKKIVEKRDK
jgi:hypothetical protein